MSAAAPARVAAIWCMDWPAVAAAAAAGLPATAPVAVVRANRVQACSAAAREAGVRRGLRRREAQSRCPLVHVAPADPGRDARFFEPVVAAVDEVVPRAEVLRPGLLVLPVGGAARYFGSEQAAAERLLDAVAATGAECQVGIADQLGTAVLAARAARVVRPGRDRAFLSGLSVRRLADEPGLSGPGYAELADLLWRMGIRTLGDFAALPRREVTSRFGPGAAAAHRIAAGERGRRPSGREPPPDLEAVLRCDPPVDRVDAAAFAGRTLAAALHRNLESAGLACTRLAIVAASADGTELSRVWRCAEPLTPEATADRVRWQLDGWLTRRGRGPLRADREGGPTGPLTTLRLQPVEVIGAGAMQLSLGDGPGAEDRMRAHRALVRVQGLLGPEAVRIPALSGGRGPTERITLTPLGDEILPRAAPDRPWPGQLPSPAPAVLFEEPVELLDRRGDPVIVSDRGMFTAEPHRLAGAGHRGRLGWWTGPWPADEDTARAQVLLDGDPPQALLLCYRRRRWYLEGGYE
jgi:protein ImuB